MSAIARMRKVARPLARFGCVSIGTVYLLVGVLALLALSGRAQGSADEDRIVHVLMQLPGGVPVIWLIILGSAGYVVWRVVEAIADPYEFGSHGTGLAKRAAVAASAAGYALIAFSAARIVTSGGMGDGESSEDEQQLLVAQVLDWPAGPWLVGGAGLLVMAFGLAQYALIARRAYTTEIDLDNRTEAARKTIHVLAWYGYAARGVILCVLGYFLLQGAWARDPEAVGDTDTAFDFIGGGLVGDSAFLIVALGTVAYGVFMYMCAVHYRFAKSDP